MDRAYSLLTVKAVEDDKRIIRGVATTPAPDRMGDVVEPLGVKYRNPLPLLHQHNGAHPVGLVKFFRPTAAGVEFEATFPRIAEPGPLRDRVETAWGEVKAGLVRAVSIGFRAIEDAVERLESGGIRFLKTEVLELSLVTIPANSEATITLVKSIDAEVLAASGRDEPKPITRAASGDKSQPIARRKPVARKSYAERIVAFEETLSAKRAEMADIMDEAEERKETLTTDEKDAYDALEREVGELRDHIKRLKILQADAASTAKPVEQETKTMDVRTGAVAAQVKAPTPEPGIRLARYARCLALASKGNRDIVSVAREQYGTRDPGVIQMVEKAAVIAYNTTTDDELIGNLGGFAEFLEFLRPMTVVGQFGQNGIPALTRIPFRTPIISEASESVAYWVGEGKPKPLTKAAAGRTELAPLKVATISVATMELLRDSSPSAETFIRNSLAKAVAKRIDQSFIDPLNDGTAGSEPASILNGITATGSVGNDADSVRQDVAAVAGAFVTANNPLNSGVWIMSATRALQLSLMNNAMGQPEFNSISMRGGTFWGLPVLLSQYVDTNIVALVNANDIYLGDEGGLTIDMSTQASLQMMDNPTNDTVSATPVATDLVSLWQTNSVGFLAERTINWVRARASAVAWLDSVDWGIDETATS